MHQETVSLSFESLTRISIKGQVILPLFLYSLTIYHEESLECSRELRNVKQHEIQRVMHLICQNKQKTSGTHTKLPYS